MMCSALAKLPPEVLSMIFEAACAVKRGPGKLFIQRDDLSPWQDRGVINLTCSYWRQVALATASLWNNLIICKKSLSHVPDLSLIPIVFERAGAVPLNTHVSYHPCNMSTVEEY